MDNMKNKTRRSFIKTYCRSYNYCSSDSSNFNGSIKKDTNYFTKFGKGSK